MFLIGCALHGSRRNDGPRRRGRDVHGRTAFASGQHVLRSRRNAHESFSGSRRHTVGCSCSGVDRDAPRKEGVAWSGRYDVATTAPDKRFAWGRRYTLGCAAKGGRRNRVPYHCGCTRRNKCFPRGRWNIAGPRCIDHGIPGSAWHCIGWRTWRWSEHPRCSWGSPRGRPCQSEQSWRARWRTSGRSSKSEQWPWRAWWRTSRRAWHERHARRASAPMHTRGCHARERGSDRQEPIWTNLPVGIRCVSRVKFAVLRQCRLIHDLEHLHDHAFTCLQLRPSVICNENLSTVPLV
mmetsp:Transcript_26047/g.68428  ORF Transcript_26047/g.68428 Transcript_26047/m.68428 type:complete len:293 (-) Transcript_26047:3169-4047(-)